MWVQSEMAADGQSVSITKLCRWLGVPRRTFYYKSVNREKKLDSDKVAKVKAKMEEFPTYGYRRLALQSQWGQALNFAFHCHQDVAKTSKTPQGKRHQTI